MAWLSFLKKTPKSFLGIDIGSSSIRVVELGRKGQSFELNNYGEMATTTLAKTNWSFSNRETAKALTAILKEAGIDTREVNFSIQDFSSFFTSFELPSMSEKELEQAVRYEARSYIPLPLSEITLDWQVVDKKNILVTAVPNDVIAQYKEIASMAELNIKALEAEIFAMARPLAKQDNKITAVIDIGARSTTCNILERGNLKMSHSFNVSGNELTEILSRSLKIDYQKAEEMKKTHGLTGINGEEREIRDILLPLVDSLIAETKRTLHNFHAQEGKETQKVVLAGGMALMPGLEKYFSQELKVETEIVNPFSSVSFPGLLTDTLKEMGPRYIIAVGLALKGLE